MRTEQHHIEGQVQGVGFRPHVWRLAQRLALTGWVRNGTDGVRIAVQGEATALDAFAAAVVAEAPPVARVTRHRRWATEPVERFDTFAIVPSDDRGARTLVLTPDLDACDACLAETRDPADRRYDYAFASCTHCGPRYSIVEALPYDRPATTMGGFPLCPDCAAEYADPADRRYHAQTTSCPVCRIPLLLRAPDGTLLAAEGNALDTAARRLAVGECIAVKGIGGYLLCCDASHAEAVGRLRQRKNRPTKPFALLAADLDAVRAVAHVDDDEADLLASRARPIVLLRRKRAALGEPDPIAEAVAPGLDRIGVMLPCAPLLARLLDRIGRPLVTTSGNVSDAPIAYADADVLRTLGPLADAFLTHPRAIAVPQDDSVATLTPTHRRRIVVRCSRGYAPTLLGPCVPIPDGLLAMGAQQKSTFALTHGGHTYVSQYLGDLHDYDTELSYAHTQAHLLDVLQASPRGVIVDRHPGYVATRLGRTQAEAWGVPVFTVQHHEAHAAAVLAENDLTDSPEPVLCVVWDGTGYGYDDREGGAQVWGGEFFVYRSASCRDLGPSAGDGAGRLPSFERAAHWAYVPHLLGDKMARQPRLAALAFTAHRLDDPATEMRLANLFDGLTWGFYRKLVHVGSGSQPTLKTSSVGRLFDAVACLIGLADTVSFEGEAAIRLEQAARRAYDAGTEAPAYPLASAHPLGDGCTAPLGTALDAALDPRVVVGHVLADLDAGRAPNAIALAFHRTLVAAVRRVAEATGTRRLAFSGGVFQNALLVDLLLDDLRGDFALHFHKQLSPNDESIAYGQAVHVALHQRQAAPTLSAAQPASTTTYATPSTL
ncbi:MAG: carbamoyltransferase HypF [Bacteroidota bacterium]